MKKIFPVIAILITLSLLGLIFFQFLWLKSAKELRTQRLQDRITYAIGNVAEELMTERSPLEIKPPKTDLLFPKNRTIDFFNSSITRRFTQDEIQTYLRRAFDSDEILRGIPFEFGVINSSLAAEPMQTRNFYNLYLDTLHNFRYAIPLTSGSGTEAEGLGMYDEALLVIVPNQESIIVRGLTGFIIGAILFTIIIATAFYLTIRTLIRQKKVSEIKNDFINNMTHEFKTPLATISLAVDALRNEKVMQDKEKSQYFTNIIKEENRRMNKQVETILQAAQLEKNEVQLNLKPASAHHLIESATNNISLPIAERNGRLHINLAAQKDSILADEVHFTNLINSLLDNAVKYSKEVPVVRLTTSNAGKNLRIVIEDEGIGMNKETLSRIFEKFYRAHTGNVHNVKGFGLGLSYVKAMVEAHKGSIRADSVPGKGSTFTVSVPLAEAAS